MKNGLNILYILIAVFMMACNGFLDAVPNKGISGVDSLDDIEALLNNVNVFNYDPGIQIVSSDDYYMTDAGWISLGRNMTQKAYLRKLDEVFEDEQLPAVWTYPYEQVFYANLCLQNLQKYVPANFSEAIKQKELIAWSRFVRGSAVFHLARTFAPQYLEGHAENQKGIPLPTIPDVNNYEPFATLEQTYKFALEDLNASLEGLPSTMRYKSQPTLAAGHALLARKYLDMNDFENAKYHSTNALELYAFLLDFNTLNPTISFPVPIANEEVIYHSISLSLWGFERNQEVRIVPELYASYDSLDLRKEIYFAQRESGAVNFRGSFTGNTELFTGLSVGEMYLIRAECHARTGDAISAQDDLNTILSSRYVSGKFIPYTLEDAGEILELVLLERRKELVFRGMRWSDLKRGAYQSVNLVRELNGETHIFSFESDNPVFAIPSEELDHR